MRINENCSGVTKSNPKIPTLGSLTCDSSDEVGTPIAKLCFDQWEREDGVNSQEQQSKSNRPTNGTTRQSPYSTCTHDYWKKINEENNQRENHQQGPFQRLEFTSEGRRSREKHGRDPSENQTTDEKDHQGNDESKFDALLNTGDWKAKRAIEPPRPRPKTIGT